MPNLDAHTQAVLAISTLIATFIHYIFNVEAPVIFAGFVGTWVGLAIAPQTSFWNGLLTIILATCTTGYAAPWLTRYIGDYPSRTVAFIFGMLVVALRKQIIEYIRTKAWPDIKKRAGAILNAVLKGSNP
jgi:hypothetical protein